MSTTTTLASTSLIGTYACNARSKALLRSEPMRPVAAPGNQVSTIADKYQDQVSLSPGGIVQSRDNEDSGQGEQSAAGTAKAGGSACKERTSTDSRGLSEAETKMIQELRARDLEVKAHELAHLTAAGQYARGGASYTYQQGPDGRRYAIGGEVSIDIGKEATPEETIQKMVTVKRAALAPAEPSATDRAIAANAAATESRARQELQTQKTLDARQQRDNNAPISRKDQALFPSSRSTKASEQRKTVNVFA